MCRFVGSHTATTNERSKFRKHFGTVYCPSSLTMLCYQVGHVGQCNGAGTSASGRGRPVLLLQSTVMCVPVEYMV